MSPNSYVTVLYPKNILMNPDRASDNFILGPIRNAPPYHEDVIDTCSRLVNEEEHEVRLRINCPKRQEHMVRGFSISSPPSGIRRMCTRQREWELDTQESAARSAGLLFFLVKKGKTEFRKKVYGAITQVEFGYWLARASVDKSLRIAFYSDGIYNGELHTLLYDIERLAPWLLPMHTTLESICAQSIAWAKTK